MSPERIGNREQRTAGRVAQATRQGTRRAPGGATPAVGLGRDPHELINVHGEYETALELPSLEAFEKVLLADLPPPDREYLYSHKKRIQKSLEWLAPHIRADIWILELGGCLFSQIFQSFCPSIRGEGTNTDLRYPLPIPSEKYDIVVNTELLEHLKDQAESPVDKFDLSGFHTLLSESYRVLKSGGIMFVTTPNASSIGIIYRTLMGWPPHYYYPHVREYTIHELRRFLESHNFAVERSATFPVYDDLPEDECKKVSNILAHHGYSVADRDDCTFIIARK